MKTYGYCAGLAAFMVTALMMGGCLHSERDVALYPATEQIVDVFTCKGLDDQGHWIQLTDQFKPEEDPRVVVAAQLRPEHRKSWITYELTSPADFVVITETIRYPKQTDLGVYFDIPRLMEMGGEGEWTAVVYDNSVPLGKATFTLGEKAEEGAGISRYHVVDNQEDLALPEETETEPSQEPATAETPSDATGTAPQQTQPQP